MQGEVRLDVLFWDPVWCEGAVSKALVGKGHYYVRDICTSVYKLGMREWERLLDSREIGIDGCFVIPLL